MASSCLPAVRGFRLLIYTFSIPRSARAVNVRAHTVSAEAPASNSAMSSSPARDEVAQRSEGPRQSAR